MIPDNRDKSVCLSGSAGARHPATRCRHSIIRPAFPNWTPQFWHSSVKGDTVRRLDTLGGRRWYLWALASPLAGALRYPVLCYLEGGQAA
jgi:hypothetical protein